MRAVRVLGFILWLVPVVAFGQATGELRPLRLIVPVTAGGTSDVVARILAERLASLSGRRVYVDNRVGGTGRLAVDALRAAEPPAEALLMAPVAVPVIAPLVFRNLSYGTSDLAPVSRVAEFDYALAVPAQSDLTTFAQFADWVRGHPDKASIGSPAVGSIPHFLGFELTRQTGIPMDSVPFAGLAQMQADLVGGHVTGAMAATTDFVRLHRAGRVRILATSGRSRSTSLPEVPTFRELGYPTLEIVGWTALFANAKLPRAEVESLSAQVRAAIADAGVATNLRTLGVEPAASTPGELASVIAADLAYWRPIIRATGFAPESP